MRSGLEADGYLEPQNYKLLKSLGGKLPHGGELLGNPRFLHEFRTGHPDPMRPTYIAEVMAEIAEHLKTLVEREERLRIEIEGPDRAEAWKRALLIADSKQAQLFQRYQAANHSVLFRSISALEKALATRDESADDASEDQAPNEANNTEESSASDCGEEILASEKRRRNRGRRPPLGRSSGPSKWS